MLCFPMYNRYNGAKIVTNEQNTKLALIFYCECRIFSSFNSKIVTNEQNTKLALIFYCECRIFSNFSSKIP